MAISDSHASHIRGVHVRFCLEAPSLDSAAVTDATGIAPTSLGKAGDPRTNRIGTMLGTHEQGWWQFSTKDMVDSKDINEHMRYLLAQVLPHSQVIRDLASSGEAFFDVLWESTCLYAGTGPVLDADVVDGMAALGAGIGFDIYQIDEDPA